MASKRNFSSAPNPTLCGIRPTQYQMLTDFVNQSDRAESEARSQGFTLDPMLLCHGDTELSKEVMLKNIFDLQPPLDGKVWYTLPRANECFIMFLRNSWDESFQRTTGIRESIDFKNFMSTKCKNYEDAWTFLTNTIYVDFIATVSKYIKELRERQLKILNNEMPQSQLDSTQKLLLNLFDGCDSEKLHEAVSPNMLIHISRTLGYPNYLNQARGTWQV